MLARNTRTTSALTACTLAMLLAAVPARAQQPSLEQAAASLPGSSRCRSLSDSDLSQLTLIGALEHVVCRSPLLSQALLLVDEQQAALTSRRRPGARVWPPMPNWQPTAFL